jgi:hypothetical protein
MKKYFYIFLICLLIFPACCRDKHFISDTEYRSKVEKQFQKQKELAMNRDSQLFAVFKQRLTTEETEALKFLFAYMPLSDLADYDGEFFFSGKCQGFAASPR